MTRTNHRRSAAIIAHEYMRMCSHLVERGFVAGTWQPPFFGVRFTSRTGHIRGLWTMSGPVRAVSLWIGPSVPLGWVYQTIAHEVTHDIVHGTNDGDHGPKFRAVLRKLVRTYWPDCPKWEMNDEPGAMACYREDDSMAAAISKLYPHVGPQHVSRRGGG